MASFYCILHFQMINVYPCQLDEYFTKIAVGSNEKNLKIVQWCPFCMQNKIWCLISLRQYLGNCAEILRSLSVFSCPPSLRPSQNRQLSCQSRLDVLGMASMRVKIVSKSLQFCSLLINRPTYLHHKRVCWGKNSRKVELRKTSTFAAFSFSPPHGYQSYAWAWNQSQTFHLFSNNYYYQLFVYLVPLCARSEQMAKHKGHDW